MLLDLEAHATPRVLSDRPAFDPEWVPDQSGVVFISQRAGTEAKIKSIFLRRLAESKDHELLPGDLATQGATEIGYIYRWLDNQTLVYDRQTGTLRQLYLLNVANYTTRPLVAEYAHDFVWSQNSSRVAGQDFRGWFWLWDLKQEQFLLPDTQLPGAVRLFEAWSSNGREALFSSWEGVGAAKKATALYRLNLEDGAFSKLADDATLAAWSGDLIAFIRTGVDLTLVVLDATTDEVIWTDRLGAKPADFLSWFKTYRPAFFGPYLTYRTAGGEWKVASADGSEIRTIYDGAEAMFAWRKDGCYTAIVELPKRQMVVAQNPLCKD